MFSTDRLSMTDSTPFHYELREATRAWLNDVCEHVFDGNVSQMASALGYKKSGRRRLLRVLRGETKTIPRSIVLDTTAFVDSLSSDTDPDLPDIDASPPYDIRSS